MELTAIHVLVLLVFQYMGIKITPAPRFHLGQLLVNIASVAQMVATMSLLVHLARLAHLVHLVCITTITLRDLRYTQRGYIIYRVLVLLITRDNLIPLYINVNTRGPH